MVEAAYRAVLLRFTSDGVRWKPKIDAFDGGPRVMTQAVEQLELCAAQKKARTPGVVAFLKKQ